MTVQAIKAGFTHLDGAECKFIKPPRPARPIPNGSLLLSLESRTRAKRTGNAHPASPSLSQRVGTRRSDPTLRRAAVHPLRNDETAERTGDGPISGAAAVAGPSGPRLRGPVPGALAVPGGVAGAAAAAVARHGGRARGRARALRRRVEFHPRAS